MNQLLTLLQRHPAIVGPWELTAWTMIWFLAAGTALAAVGALVRLLIRPCSANVRYAFALTLFVTLAALPLGIAVTLNTTLTVSQPPLPTSLTPLIPSSQIIELTELTANENPVAMETPLAAPLPEVFPNPVEPAQQAWNWNAAVAYLPWFWLVGTPATFLLLATGLIGSERLRRQASTINAGVLHESASRLRDGLRITRQVTIAVSERIASPILVGILRPIILLPPAALTGWSPEEIEMVLLHELAHVRRYDNLVNLAQRVVESLLFFHPAVWLASRWVRHEREACCDAIVVHHTAKPQAYAELLINLATPTRYNTHTYGMATSVAMAQHPLATRIRRILNLEEETMLVTRKSLAMAVAASAALVLAVATVDVRRTEAARNDDDATADGFTVESTEEAGGTPAERDANPFEDSTPPLAVSPSLFPTLEEQRNIDLAYKLLGVELEKISDEELQRVKAMGYEGALRVGGLHYSSQQQMMQQQMRQQQGLTGGSLLIEGDLLVGLHVWPTRSLDDVKQVLTRDDLAGLSPLKFYVVRSVPQGENHGDGGYGLGEFDGGRPESREDKLVTGRIEVSPSAIQELKVQVPQPTAAVWPALQTHPVPTPVPLNTPGNAPRLLTPPGEYSDPEPSGSTYLDPSGSTYSPALLPGQSVLPHYVISPPATAVSRRELELNVEKAEIELQEAAQQFEMIKQRADGGTVSPTEESQKKRALDVAKIEVERAKARLESLDKPFVAVEADELLRPGMCVVVEAIGVDPANPINGTFHIESMGTVALGATYGRVKVAGKTLLEAEEEVTRHLKEAWQKPVVQITLPLLSIAPAYYTPTTYTPTTQPTPIREEGFNSR